MVEATDDEALSQSQVREVARLLAVQATELLDTQPEESFDRLTRLAARTLGTPISLMSLIDTDRQFFKSVHGLQEPWATRRETPLLLSFCQYAARAKTALVVGDARRDTRFADHQAIPELGVAAYLGVPLTLADGQPLGAFCVIDTRPRRWSKGQIRLIRELGALVVSELELRKRMRETARLRQLSEDSELRLRLLLESTGEGIYGVDRDGLCTFSNRAAADMLGYTSDELVGQHMHSLIHHSHGDGRRYAVEDCRVYHAFRTGQSTSVDDEVLWRKDGSGFDAEYWAYPVRRNDELDGAVVTFRDITNRKRREATLAHYTRQLEQSDRRKDEFLAVLGHELRNPLAAISATAELLATAADADPKAIEAGVSITEHVGLLTVLLDDLLDVGRITRGSIQLRRQRTPLRHVVDHAVGTARSAIDAGQHAVQVDVDPGLHADVDPVRLEQVLVNLLTNAAKYTERDGSIQVRTWADGQALHLSVTDNGRGIDPAVQADVFEPFHQVHAGPGGPGGLGIGLTLVKRLVELHGGQVELASAGLGLGCQVHIVLPDAVRPGPDTATGAGGPPPAPGPAARQRVRDVLVVDDNRSAADGIVKLLQRVGYGAEAAYCGLDAVARAEQKSFQAALVDIGLPDISGYEVAERLRDGRGGGDLLLIALSGFGHAEARQTARDAGFDLHLAKPAPLATLRAALDGQPPQGA